MEEKKRLLLVDDEKDFARSLKLYLEMENYEVDMVNSGSEALVKAENNSYHLVISDILMPEMDGYELRKKLRTIPGTKKVPIILLTAKEADVESLKEIHDGATSFIMKPFEHTLLLDEIKNLIEHRAARELP
ncbi:MAG: response regulator [Candidatus Eremiobacteraeota bacterium]|nr:response regulator [Candidatus Eremiobacteraeota bacterium]